MAEVFAGAGRSVVAVGRREQAVQGLASKLGCQGRVADALDPEDVGRLYRELSAEGPIAGLLHCVGGFSMQPLPTAELLVFERMISMNVTSLFLNARAASSSMIQTGGGFIAGVSSELAWAGQGPGAAVYAASKAAATTLLRSLDAELSGQGVRASVVYPMAAVDTPANRRDMPDVDPSTWVKPEAIAAALLTASACTADGHLRELPLWPTSQSAAERP